jgi:uncharacterized protein
MVSPINIADIPSECLCIHYEIQPSDMALPSEDGQVLGSMTCAGQVFLTDDKMVHFQGTLTGRVSRECVRCLNIFEGELALSCDADFCQPAQSVHSTGVNNKKKKGRHESNRSMNEEHENEIDTYPITDNQVDLLPALREHLILATPLHPLCQENCSGLCQKCGANLNEGICACYSPVTVSSSLVSDAQPMLSQKALQSFPGPVRSGA